MQLDTINTLYLELSQVATATTAKELALKKELAEIDAELWPDGDKPENYAPDRALRVRAILHLANKNAKALESAREALRAIVKNADCPRAHEIAYDELGMANASDEPRPLGAVGSGRLFEEPAGKPSANSKLQKSAD